MNPVKIAWIRFICLAFAISLPLSSGTTAEESKGPLNSREIVLIVNRDSNDIRWMDMRSRKIVGTVSLGPWANPHMAMITHDGRKVVVSGTKVNKGYIIDLSSQKIEATIELGISPEHLDISPDSRYAYVGNFEDGSVSVLDLVANRELKRLTGFAEPHNITFLPDGSKVYVANLGAHWIGVVDGRRHELLKKILIARPNVPTQLHPDRYLNEINGIVNVTLTLDGRYAYAADGDFDVVGVIDTREDRLVATIPVGDRPWEAYRSPDGTHMVVPNNGDETISIINIATNRVVATLEAGPDMVGVNFSNGKAFVISSSSSFVYVYDLKRLKPMGRIKIGDNLILETAATDAEGQRIYLACSTNQSIYEINGKTHQVVRIPDVGLFPWGTHIHEGQDNYCH